MLFLFLYAFLKDSLFLV